jgi:acyl carrier protein phosphodiesterase
MQAEPTFFVSNAWELRFPELPFIREVLVNKVEQLGYRTAALSRSFSATA